MTDSLEPTFVPAQEPDAQGPPAELAERASQTTAENPWPLHVLSNKLHGYISQCAPTWVEGQIIELNKRARVTYLTLRDVHEEVSVPVTLFAQETMRLESDLERGQRVVVQLKPDFWVKSGRLSMLGHGIRPVGLGTMLERIEKLRQKLAAEGLFAQHHKKPLPVLPHRVGLITGRDSDAEKDVIRNASLRWPSVEFEVREVAVQGVNALRQVTLALQELDANPHVDVIIIARGGGSMEDLLAFSEEALVRAVFAAQTPVISAIGHEADAPLLDYVADVRASTPTDAGKRVVPDVEEERLRVSQARVFLARSAEAYIDREFNALQQLRTRPALQNPESTLLQREEDIDRLRARAHSAAHYQISRATDVVQQLKARVRALSPQHTLERGYALAQREDGSLIKNAQELAPGESIVVRAAQGSARATVESTQASNIPPVERS
ncbi:MAG: exodeoxyribonuclease VII large subunit [Rothia sp. (in: high G+C Gram-positive bacteria)]|nr:exodeoxyribonuclease VII large subunit [Rothia sp. (in: high G+C Gram-positive bacteria)]